MATRGHDLEYGGTKEVLVVESPHPDDAVVPVEFLGGAGAGRASLLSVGSRDAIPDQPASCEVGGTRARSWG